MNKEKTFTIYRLEAFGSYYYGFTTNPEGRLWGHLKSIRLLLKNELLNCDHKDTRLLRFHHFAAKEMRRRSTPMNNLKYHVRMTVVYQSTVEQDALDVETFLVIKSKRDKKCFNDKILYKNVNK